MHGPIRISSVRPKKATGEFAIKRHLWSLGKPQEGLKPPKNHVAHLCRGVSRTSHGLPRSCAVLLPRNRSGSVSSPRPCGTRLPFGCETDRAHRSCSGGPRYCPRRVEHPSQCPRQPLVKPPHQGQLSTLDGGNAQKKAAKKKCAPLLRATRPTNVDVHATLGPPPG